MATPLVSICIPVHNGEKFILDALESAVAQTHSNIELIVNNDGSTDSTKSIVEDFFARHSTIPSLLINSEKPNGSSHSYSAACNSARGEYVKMVCHDDRMLPDCVAEQVKAMEENPGVTLAVCRRRIINARGNVMVAPNRLGKTGRYKGLKIAKWCARYGVNAIGEPMGVLFRKSDKLLCGDFSPEMKYFNDIDFWLRFLMRGDLYYINKPLADFRVHGTSCTSRSGKYIGGELKIWERNMELMGLIANKPPDRFVRRISVWSQFVVREVIVRFSAHGQ